MKLVIAITINCFPSRVYGQMEYYLSCMKVLTIVCIGKHHANFLHGGISPEVSVLLGLIIDLGASHEGYVPFILDYNLMA